MVEEGTVHCTLYKLKNLTTSLFHIISVIKSLTQLQQLQKGEYWLIDVYDTKDKREEKHRCFKIV